MSTTLDTLKASPLEHLGQRVITLGQMDEVHGRPEGTARRAFNKHKAKLELGRHYFQAPADVSRTPDGRLAGAAEITLLTERGYLVLVKTFRDDLAWRVQEQLVDGYFRARADAIDPAMEAVRQLSQVITGFVQGMLSAHEREIRILTRATEDRFAEQERQIKQLRRGARVQATGRAGGSDRKVAPRSPRPLVVADALPLLPGDSK